DEELSEYEGQLSLTLHPYLRRIYGLFDGFLSCDKKSHFLLWPMKRIVQCSNSSVGVGTEKYLPIGDFLIDSDFLMCCLEKQPDPVFLLYEQRELGNNLSGFFIKLISGEFDFMG